VIGVVIHRESCIEGVGKQWKKVEIVNGRNGVSSEDNYGAIRIDGNSEQFVNFWMDGINGTGAGEGQASGNGSWFLVGSGGGPCHVELVMCGGKQCHFRGFKSELLMGGLMSVFVIGIVLLVFFRQGYGEVVGGSVITRFVSFLWS
jgi:hypothetical protein